MGVLGYDREVMLAGKCRNPKIVHRDRGSSRFQLVPDHGIAAGGEFVDWEDPGSRLELFQGFLQRNSTSGTEEAEPVFPKDN